MLLNSRLKNLIQSNKQPLKNFEQKSVKHFKEGYYGNRYNIGGSGEIKGEVTT